MKTTLFAVITALLLCAPIVAAAQSADVEAVCAQTACREGGYKAMVIVENKDGGKFSFTEVSVTHSPYVLGKGEIMIFPGETIAYSLRIDGNKVTPVFLKRYAPEMPAKVFADGHPRTNPADTGLPVVERDAKGNPVLPPDTLLLSYGQQDGLPGMVLVLQHTLPVRLKPDALMAVFKKGGGYDIVPTSTCPVRVGMFTMEHWPHPIGPIILKSLTVLPERADMVCK